MGSGRAEIDGCPSAQAAKEALGDLYRELYAEYVQVRNPPRTIYHCCSAQVMRRILFESHSLWASDLFSMKDQKEFTYPFSGTFDFDRETAQELWRRVCVHIACLSADAELPSQWRDYADGHKGCAIGFRANAVDEFAPLIPMTYDPRRHAELKRRFCDGAGAILRHARLQLDRAVHEQDLHWEATKYLTSLAMTMKRGCFKEEREWRILLMQAKQAATDKPRRFEPFLRPDNHACCFNLPIATADFVEEVVVGSRCSEDVEELGHELIRGGFATINVRRSSLPCAEQPIRISAG